MRKVEIKGVWMNTFGTASGPTKYPNLAKFPYRRSYTRLQI
jgi:hypothetical protein